MKTYHIYNQGKFEYILEVDNSTENSTRYILKYSSAPHWYHPFEIILSVIDNGDNLNFEKEIGSILNYAEVLHLTLMFRLISSLRKEDSEFFVVCEESQYKIEI